MRGFFNIASAPAKVSGGKREKIVSCPCSLATTCHSPKMEVTGHGKRGIFVLAEAPGKEEDERGVQLIGKAGQKLRQALRDLGIDLDRDCWKMNAVNCRPPDNRTPTPHEVNCCRARVFKAIQERQPKVIIPLGNVALQCLYDGRTNFDLGVALWRGWTILDRLFEAWVCPTFHPSYILRMARDYDDPLPTVWGLDLAQAIEKAKWPLPLLTNEEEKVEILDEPTASGFLREFRPGNPVAVDYETTGLKPHAPGHAIVSASLCASPDVAFSFLVTEGLKPLLREFLRSDVKKIAANFKFEELWSRVILGTPVRNWIFDTMLAAHVLDNRRGVTSVKWQALVHFGVLDYDSKVKPFMQAERANDLNRMQELAETDPKTLLIYGGLDALFEYRLACLQRKKLI